MPLCPATASASMPVPRMSTGMCPQAWAPSQTVSTRAGSSARTAAGSTAAPVTLEARVNTAATVFSRTAAAMPSGVGAPPCSGTTLTSAMPARSSAYSGRSTALCSASVVTKCGFARPPPAARRPAPAARAFEPAARPSSARTAACARPKMAALSASVQFLVKTTRSQLSPPKKRQSSLRQRSTFSAAAAAAACPPRPGLAHPSSAAATAPATAGGLVPPVAALSK